jgi:pimeloyl-ACP methyl ester carboxylesterase
MQTIRVNGYDMAYLDVGQSSAPPLVCVHGSLCDFRIWSPVMGPLTRHHRLICVSLRHCFPEAWDGQGDGYDLAQHIDDLIAFIPQLGLGPVDLMGHSRGGYVAFRAALRRPELVRRLILAEPGGELDASLGEPSVAPDGKSRIGDMIAESGRRAVAGDRDGALKHFIDTLEGDGVWERIPPTPKQLLRDNAITLVGQAKEQRLPFTRAEAEALAMPTLLIGGARTKGPLRAIMEALSAHIPGARTIYLERASHPMFEQKPVDYAQAVSDFLRA